LGIKKPTNQFTKLLSYDKTNLGSSWSIILLILSHPTEIRIYEQFAIFIFNPSLNRTKNISVYTRYLTEDLQGAIDCVKFIKNLYSNNSLEYKKFQEMEDNLIQMSNVYNEAKLKKINLKINELKHGKPLIIYNIITGEIENYYSSSNKSIKHLKIKWKTLIDSIKNKWIINDKYIPSYKPLSKEELKLEVRAVPLAPPHLKSTCQNCKSIIFK